MDEHCKEIGAIGISSVKKLPNGIFFSSPKLVFNKFFLQFKHDRVTVWLLLKVWR